jgi:hypothetical protein
VGRRLRVSLHRDHPFRDFTQIQAFAEGVWCASHRWTKFYSRLMGFYDCVAQSRVLRWSGFDDKGAARCSIDALLSHDFEGLIVGHGEPIPELGRQALTAATAWLPAAAPRLPSVAKRQSERALHECAGRPSGRRTRA